MHHSYTNRLPSVREQLYMAFLHAARNGVKQGGIILNQNIALAWSADAFADGVTDEDRARTFNECYDALQRGEYTPRL